jgi:hypothetical protein
VVPFALRYERELLRPLARADRARLDRILRQLHARATDLGPITYNRGPQAQARAARGPRDGTRRARARGRE